MASLSVTDIFPASGQQGVPLGVNPYIVLTGEDYDEDSLLDGLFLEGPDTDQFVGPGLLELRSTNVSQGEIDDFLQSPGYQGIVAGTVTVSGISGNTRVTFVPTYYLSPLTEYIINFHGAKDAAGDDITGYVYSDFTTGSGSITAVPSSSSSTVLSSTASESGAGTTVDDLLSVVSSDPEDNETGVATDISEITITFNKAINSNTVAGNVTVKTIPASDHPNASTNSLGDLAITTEVSGSELKIKI